MTTTTLVIMGAAGLLILINVYLLQMRPAAVSWMSALLIFGAHFSVVGIGTLSLLIKAFGYALLLASLVSGWRSGAKRRSSPLSVIYVAGLVLFALAVICDHSLFALEAALSFAAVAGLFVLVGASAYLAEVAVTFRIVNWLIVALSLPFGYAVPAVGFAGGRLRGFYANANMLAFLAGLAIIVALRRLTWRTIPAVAVPVVVLLLTGGRSAVVAVACAVGIYLLGFMIRGRIITGFAVLAGMAAAAVAAARLLPGATKILFRKDASRSTDMYYALNTADWSFLGGVGYRNEMSEIASTPLRWLAQEGVVALGVVLLAYLAVLFLALNCGTRTLAVATFGVASSLLEGWYFAATSCLFVAHALMLLDARSQDAVARSARAAVALSGRKGRRRVSWPRRRSRAQLVTGAG